MKKVINAALIVSMLTNILVVVFFLHLRAQTFSLRDKLNYEVERYNNFKNDVNESVLANYQVSNTEINSKYFVRSVVKNSFMKFSNYYKKNDNTLIIRLPRFSCELCYRDFFERLKKVVNTDSWNKVLVVTSDEDCINISNYLKTLGLNIQVLGARRLMETDLNESTSPYMYILSAQGISDNYLIIYKQNISLAMDYIKLMIKKYKLLKG